jgi:DNA-binding transcriptional LysR family regulator
MPNVDLNDVALFVRVVDREGFAKVARDVRVPTSTVSRAVSRLEATVGTQLLVRSTRSVVPTAEGRAFYQEVAPAVAALNHAARGVDGADKQVRGKLRVTAANDVGATFLGEVVADFCERYPDVEIETLLTGRSVNLVEEGIDVALRAAARLPDSSLVVRKLGELEQDLYASPRYLEQRGTPMELEDVRSHRVVLFRAPEGTAEWALRDAAGAAVPITVTGRIVGDDFMFVRAAVIGGAGIGLLPRIVVNSDVEAGRLVRVLPLYSAREASLFFVHVPATTLPARIAAFRDFMVEAFVRCRAPRK